MQSQKELDTATNGYSSSATRHLAPQVVSRAPSLNNIDKASREQMNSEKLHSLLDATNGHLPTFRLTPPENKPVTTGGFKAAKKSCLLDEDASKTIQSDRECPVKDDVVAPQQRTTHRAKSVRSRKRAKALIKSSDSESEQEEALSESDDEDSYNSGTFFPYHGSLSVSGTDLKFGGNESTLLDPQGEPLF
ncbi:Hypothetical predicted protein [Pelobates cultripes]|uniref:Uncharacterized protein n=1 Tax=Pelobates cultripes TaxID=61616 RepID=A0AAD1RWC0_PELCU|nr:Hypothetical predicted protein [Pelobates cultripes]